MYHHSSTYTPPPMYSGYRTQAPVPPYVPAAISPQLLVATNVTQPIVPGSYSPDEDAPESPRAGRNISGCLCCRVRHKRCGLDQDQYGRCSTCRNLNIECMKGYNQEYPRGLKDKKNKERCLAAIRDWTKHAAHRAAPRPLPLMHFCHDASISPSLPSCSPVAVEADADWTPADLGSYPSSTTSGSWTWIGPPELEGDLDKSTQYLVERLPAEPIRWHMDRSTRGITESYFDNLTPNNSTAPRQLGFSRDNTNDSYEQTAFPSYRPY